MPQPYTLVARPVILSENKTNVISHGRPLSPIGTVRSARQFFVQQIKGSFAEEKHGDTISHKPPSTGTLSGYSSYHYLEYQKSANDNLMTINNNLSIMLKESFAGIDSICQKVRLCLLEANSIKPPENLRTLLTESVQLNITENRETRTAEDLDSCMSASVANRSVKSTENHLPDNRPTNCDNGLSICTEEAESNASIDEIPDLPEDVNEIAEIVEEIADDETKIKKTKNFRRTPSITPFFTILNPKTHSAESVTLIKSMTSKLGLSRKCTTENFQKTMKEVAKLADYENFLNCMVESINKEINECYSQYPKCAEAMKQDSTKNGPKYAKKNDEKKSVASKSEPLRSKKRRGESAISEQLKKFHVIHKMHRDLTEDQLSYNDLTPNLYTGRRIASIERLDFTSPDVYRKRAITDLHKRLEAQIEANDSLIFFQKLMAKNKKHLNQGRPISEHKEKRTESNLLKTATQYFVSPKGQTESKKERSLSDLSKKYQNSLWFKQNKIELKRTKKEPLSLKKKREKKEKKAKKLIPRTYSIESSVSEISRKSKSTPSKPSVKPPLTPPAVSQCNCKIKITNNQPMSEAQKCKIHWMRAKYSLLKNRKLKYLDILDDITKNDLLPIQAEYPRRDEIKSTVGAKASYLYKLTCEKTRDSQNAWKQLFESTAKWSQENCQTCNNSTTMMVQQSCHTVNVMTMAQEYSRKSNVITMDHKEDLNKETCGIKDIQSNTFPVQSKAICDMEKGDVIRKLSKYIFPDVVAESPKRVFTVMPVHVFYDNIPKISLENRKKAEAPHHLLPLMPMKETKEFVKKAEWNDGTKKSRPMRVVYDPILRKIEKEIRMVNLKPPPSKKTENQKSFQAHSWSPKNFSKYCAPTRCTNEPRAKIDAIEKGPLKRRNSTGPNARPQITELFTKRSPKHSSEKVHHPVPLPVWNFQHLEPHQQQRETDVGEKIKKTISAEANFRMKSDQQRKMWEHKYGKSVGQKLLNFIEKQPNQYQLPVPKYAMPKAAFNPARHQMMLDQLRCLKQKNDSIQTNIQKAIQVIEDKMIDILSKPTTSQSIEAFDEMEKEITNVLSLMKTPSNKAIARRDKIRAGDNGNVSDELFHRLDRILESPGMSSSGKSSSKSNSKQNKTIKGKNKFNKNLPPKSTDMHQVRFSSTSATGEEKFTITGISPKRPFKLVTRIPPYIKDGCDNNPIVPDSDNDVSTNSSELAQLLENKLKRKKMERTTETSETESEPIREFPPPIKTRKPRHEQVAVNLALFPREGSAGDQLQELKRLLENELKYVDLSDDKTPSIGVSYSQGDYEVRDSGHKEADSKGSEEVTSKNAELEADVASKAKEDASATLKPQISKSKSLTNVSEGIGVRTEESAETTSSKMTEVIDDVLLTQETPPQSHTSPTVQVTVDLPPMEGEHEQNLLNIAKVTDDVQTIQEKPETQPTTVLQLRGSQLSLTGPYFTPLTSPLVKNRPPNDEDQIQCHPIVEEKQNCQTEENATKQIGQVEDVGDRSPGEKEHDSNDVTLSDDGEESKIENKVAEEEKQERPVEKTRQCDGSTAEEENTETRDYFYENVNRIISRVENVYSQLEEFEEEMLQEELKLKSSLTPKMSPYDHDLSVTEGDETDLFLAPFINAVKDLRQSVSNDTAAAPPSRKSSPRKSSSLYNVLSFLDNLAVAGAVEEERPVDVYTPRVWCSSYVMNIPQTIYQAYIYHTSMLHQPQLVPKEETALIPRAVAVVSDEESSRTPQLPPPIRKEIKKKAGCLKNMSTSRSNVNTVSSKSKQKVSFLLHKEEKSTQMSSCPFHSVSRILSNYTMSGSTDALASSKKDEQVGACLDARENKSVDKMSLPDDETTYQSTFEFSDVTSSDNGSSLMPEQIIQNLQEALEKREDVLIKKNVVDIFSSSNSEDTHSPSPLPVKVFNAKNDAGVFESDVGDLESDVPNKKTHDEIKVFSEQVVGEAFGGVSKEASSKGSVKVFYDDFKSRQENVDLQCISGFYNEDSISQVKRSLSTDRAVKKQNSLEKLIRNLTDGTLTVAILKESSLLEPLKNLSNFVDSKLLTEAVEKRQAIRIMKRKSTRDLTTSDERVTIMPMQKSTKGDDRGEKENLLKGFYVFVYFIMFTALNLEYKCVQ